MDLNIATVSIRLQLKGIAAGVQASKEKAKRRKANQVKAKTRLDKVERGRRAKLRME